MLYFWKGFSYETLQVWKFCFFGYGNVAWYETNFAPLNSPLFLSSPQSLSKIDFRHLRLTVFVISRTSILTGLPSTACGSHAVPMERLHLLCVGFDGRDNKRKTVLSFIISSPEMQYIPPRRSSDYPIKFICVPDVFVRRICNYAQKLRQMYVHNCVIVRAQFLAVNAI